MSLNSKHLGKGSECPPLKDGKLRIYNMRFCPYAQRAVLVALAKGLPIDVVNCSLIDKPEWLLEKNPNGKVPTIELQDGRVLYESLIVADFIDEAYKNRPLNASDPFQKALDRIWVEEYSKVTTFFYKMVFAIKAKDHDALKQHCKDLQSALGPFEKELAKRGTTFFGGDNLPGMLDYMIWPWIERLPALKSLTSVDIFDFEAAKKENPKLENWRQAMKQDQAVQQAIVAAEVHKEFMESFLAGTPKYDLLEGQ